MSEVDKLKIIVNDLLNRLDYDLNAVTVYDKMNQYNHKYSSEVVNTASNLLVAFSANYGFYTMPDITDICIILSVNFYNKVSTDPYILTMIEEIKIIHKDNELDLVTRKILGL